MIGHITKFNKHVYRVSQFRLYVVALFLLVSGTGERLGVNFHGDSYRDANIALCYKFGVSFGKPPSLP